MPDRPSNPSFNPSAEPGLASANAPLAELLQRAIERSDEGFALYDASEEPALVYANPSFSRLLSLPPATVASRELPALFDDTYVSRAVRSALGRQEGCTLHAAANSDPPATLVVVLSAIRDGEGQIAQWLCTVRAKGPEHASERARAEHERLSAVTLVAAGLAHEINNPLASITTNLEWLVTSLPNNRGPQTAPRTNELDALSAALVDALAGAERIEATVRQLQALTGAQHEAAELLDVRVLLDAALHEVEPLLSGGIEVRRSYAEVPPIRGMQGRLRQAFAQLLGNAAQAITPTSPRRFIEVRVENAARVRIEIDDSGAGIAPHVQSELFRPFVTTKPLGWGKGLGLFIARSSIEAASGTIGFERLPGGGTRFWVELPSADSHPRQAFDSNSDIESVPPR